ncbi:protein involved in sex pheromone biosynthesis [Peribacillus deserti]|uniref:Protein involved in sex pheromone biosynthesis n=1 Tax=Peribacillus deserti TaxID=673318 RepID=A0ABS2QIA4_9BACI|nr:CamS family sex pheromone protein [Peribacillus deserti]MBM7692695.1 protein involved in sex pheromone biosynthesis [Peribacillus deserti]
MKKKISFIGLALLLLLTACAPKFDKQEEVIQNSEAKKEKAIIPKYKISEKYYRTTLPFEPGEARGLVVANLNTRYDINEFETGLMRVAQHTFDPDKYLFKEGQFLDKKTVSLWLNRKFTKSQLKAEGLKEEENIGLNPLDPEKGNMDKRQQENPLYLAHILEHDYLIKSDKNTVGLGGVVIGLALNSVHYYKKEDFGADYETQIPKSELMAEGKRIAQEVLQRLRKKSELKQVPITIALFEQAPKTSAVPGSFLAYTAVGEGENNLGKWENINEKYELFPPPKTDEKHREDVNSFLNFKQDVEEYFPNFNGVIGRAFYSGDQLQDLSIKIPIQFYGKAEAIGFTQYVTGLVMQHFPEYVTVEVNITSVNGPEALIVRKPETSEPFVHIYE